MKWGLYALCGIGVYLAVGLCVALFIAASWNRQKGPFDASAHILAWPLTLVLLFVSLVRDAFNSMCGAINQAAMKDAKPMVQKSFWSKIRVR